MAKFAYAERVVKKAKKLLSYNRLAQDIMEHVPQIRITKDFELEYIWWNYYEYTLIIGSTFIELRKGYNSENMMKYKSFNEFLSMKNIGEFGW